MNVNAGLFNKVSSTNEPKGETRWRRKLGKAEESITDHFCRKYPRIKQYFTNKQTQKENILDTKAMIEDCRGKWCI